jgi:hypothetical protein
MKKPTKDQEALLRFITDPDHVQGPALDLPADWLVIEQAPPRMISNVAHERPATVFLSKAGFAQWQKLNTPHERRRKLD